jgi:hypothetical protein
MSRTFNDESVKAAMWSSHSQLTVNLNRRISDGITDMKNMTSLEVFENDHAISIGERKRMSIRQRPGHTWTRRKEMWIKKQKEGWNFRSTKVDGFRPSSGIYVYTKHFRIESKGKSSAETCHLCFSPILDQPLFIHLQTQLSLSENFGIKGYI